MSRRNQARRRRSYGRRQHELGERRSSPEVRLFLEDEEQAQPMAADGGDDRAPGEPRMAGG